MKKLVVGAIVLGYLAAFAYDPSGSTRPERKSGTSQTRPATAGLTLVIDRAKAASHGLTQGEIIRTINLATNSSVNDDYVVWIDDRDSTRCFVGVHYRDEKSRTDHDILNIELTSRARGTPIPFGSVATIEESTWHGLSKWLMTWVWQVGPD